MLGAGQMLWRGLTGACDKAPCFVTDRGRDVVTRSRGFCAQSTQASASDCCYDLLSTCITRGSAGCVGSIMELQLFLDTRQLLSFKKKNAYNGQKKAFVQLSFKISLALATRSLALECQAAHEDI